MGRGTRTHGFGPAAPALTAIEVATAGRAIVVPEEDLAIVTGAMAGVGAGILNAHSRPAGIGARCGARSLCTRAQGPSPSPSFSAGPSERKALLYDSYTCSDTSMRSGAVSSPLQAALDCWEACLAKRRMEEQLQGAGPAMPNSVVSAVA